jgi:hypothetical protein
MQKSLGIAALAISIIAIFIPFLGTWLTIPVAGLAAFAYGPGRAMGIAGIVINVFHIFFLSPLLWATGGLAAVADQAAKQTGSGSAEGAGAFMAMPWILVAIQIAALVFLIRSNKKRSAPAAA